MPRTATIQRKTNETDITIELDLDGSGYENKTGVGFFDHMLDHVAKHGRFGMKVSAQGDYQIDDHHTVEDVGIALGEALVQAIGDKKGIERYGSSFVPMDDALCHVVVDLSGRPAFVFNVDFQAPLGKIGAFDVQLVREFFNALAMTGRMNLHARCLYGVNDHHIAEGLFKALGRALRDAVAITSDEVPSTKGVI